MDGGPPADRAWRRPLTVGLLGALLLLTGGLLVRALAAAPFAPVDESANVDYAVQATHGHLPRAGATPITPEFPGQRAALQHASNHPPLYHLIAGALLRIGLHAGHPDATIFLTRAVNLLFAALAVLAVAALGWSLAVGRDAAVGRRGTAVVVGAAGLAAAFPVLITASAIVENDALATGLLVVALVGTVRMIRFGPDRRRLALTAAAAAAAAATRATSVPAVVLMMLALYVAGVCWPADPTRDWPRRALSALGPPAVVGAAVAVVAGWFLVLNQRRYGDWTGGTAVEEILRLHVHQREPASSSLLHYLTAPGSWFLQFTQVAGGPDRGTLSVSALVRTLAAVLLGVLALGVLALLVRSRRWWSAWSRRQVLCAALLLVLVAAAMGEIGVHAVAGGLPHGRYLLPALGPLAVGAAVALVALPAALAPVAVGGVLAIEVTGTLLTLHEMLHRNGVGGAVLSVPANGIRTAGVPHPTLLAAILLTAMAVGLLLQVAALGLLLWRRDGDQPRHAQHRTRPVPVPV